MSEVLDAALAYARRGWPVFPCDPAVTAEGKVSKAPLVGKGGLHKATTDEATIRKWWARWPDAMIGLPTGAALGAFVVDLDPRDEDCAALWRALEAHVGCGLGDPPVAETQSGGWHLYFAWPELAEHERLGNRAGVIDGVDVRGEGGYVIAPPSLTGAGTRYGWRAQGTGARGLPAAPAALLDCLLRRGAFGPGRGGEAAPVRRPLSATDKVRRYALAALDDELRALAAAAAGTRNDRLNEAAFRLGQLVGAGALAESVVRAGLEDVAGAWPNIRKSRGTIASGVAAGMAQPRDLAEVERGAPQPRPEGSGGGSGRPPDGPGAPPGEPPGLDPTVLAANAAREANDTGNGHRLLSWFADDILYVRDVGWHVWDGTRWRMEGGDEAVSRFAQETARRIRSEAEIVGERAVAAAEARGAKKPDAARETAENRRRNFALTSGNAGKLAAMTAIAATHRAVAVHDLDADPLAINLLNGTLKVLRPGGDDGCTDVGFRLEPHRPDDMIAKRMNAAYEPGAAAPAWEALLDRFVPDPAVRWWLQRWHGYALTGLVDAQILSFNHGLGANGKTTFAEAIRRLMGDYAAALPAEAVTGEQHRRSDQATPEWARLPGVRLVLIGELPRNAPLKEETIKLVTGGEPMLVRHLNKGFVELRPVFKPVMTGNHKPQATGSDYAVWRRLRLVPWTQRLQEHERRPMGEVLAELEAEAAGILNWLLDGLAGYLRDGLGAPPAITEATEAYRAEMDPVGEWWKECVEPRPGNEVPARAMYEAYISWCEANAVTPYKEARFGREMQRLPVEKKDGRVRKYLNVILRDVPTRSEEEPAWQGWER